MTDSAIVINQSLCYLFYMEQYETLPQPPQEDSARHIIEDLLEGAKKMGFRIKLPVSPELEMEFISGGSHEVMRFILNGGLLITLTEDDSKGERYNEVIVIGRDRSGRAVEVRYDKEGNKKDPKIAPNQQKEHQLEQPSTFNYPEDFPEKIELGKVVKELKENFRTRIAPKTNILSKSGKSKIAGNLTAVTKTA